MSTLENEIEGAIPTTNAAEPFLPGSDALKGDGESTAGGEARRWIFYLQGIAFCLGAGLLIFVINKVGMQLIFDALGQIGFGFFTLLAIIAARHSLRTLAMSIAIPPQYRRFNFLQAFFARIGGEAVTFLTFTGPLLGEATKAALLRSRVPLGTSVRALVVDNLLYNLSVALFILSGACVMLGSYDLPDVACYALIGIAAAATATLLAVAWAASRRMMPLTSILNTLIGFGLKKRQRAARPRPQNRIECLRFLQTSACNVLCDDRP